MDFNKATEILNKYGYSVTKKKTTTKEITENEKIVTDNSKKFVKEGKRYAGKHPVFDSKKFQEYLLKECGYNCDDEECCDNECCDGDDCCPNCCSNPCKCDEIEELKICPECDGNGCEYCNQLGYIEEENIDDLYPEGIADISSDIDDYDLDDLSYIEDEDEYLNTKKMHNFDRARFNRD